MKIAISTLNDNWCQRWIEYCTINGIDYKIVDPFADDVIETLSDCDAFMWHYQNSLFPDRLIAKELLYSIEHSGKIVFPNFQTNWFFDDKVGQKYLMESMDLPLVPTTLFFDKKTAKQWIKTKASFPLVFKLRNGAASINVKLLKSKNEANRMINKAFGCGFASFDKVAYLKEKIRHTKIGKDRLGIIKGIYRLFITPKGYRKIQREVNYIYFQQFMPKNDCDIRVIVVGDKAFAFKRLNRDGDFRASGSGNFVYDKNQIDERCVKIAFESNDKIKSQCIAFDFIFDKNQQPLIVEISYGFVMKVYDKCEGYWDRELNWHPGVFKPQYWMVENVAKEFAAQRNG